MTSAELLERIQADPALRRLLTVADPQEDADPGHDLAHSLRVALWTLRLGGHELDASEAIAAALLHDAVNLPKSSPERASASERSAELASDLLGQAGFAPEAVERIRQAIEDHSFSRGAVPRSPLGRALQDADRLEALGALGVLRTASCGARMGARYLDLADPWAKARPLDDRRFTVDHFFVKLLLLEQTLHTEAGRSEARRRSAFMREFLRELGEEIGDPPPALPERVRVSTRSLNDGSESFDVTALEVAAASRVVLFAVGAGGDPTRHLPLLTALAERGCTVVAPHFERLLSPLPTDGELLRRARRLSIALGSVARPRVPVAGVGHSIGATMLLALAGGEVWMRPGQRLSIPPERCMDRLVLLAPATGFFQVPGALDAVSTPILAWAGTQDVVTPPAQARALERALGTRVPVEVRIVDGAGHFSFMNVPPPQTTEPLPDRDTFLAELVAEVCRFVTS